MIYPPKAIAEKYASFEGTHPNLSKWEHKVLQNVSRQFCVKGKLHLRRTRTWWVLHYKIQPERKPKPDLELPDLYDRSSFYLTRIQR